ncbi:hypothetical protein [Nonomuraea sp. NPDC023979]|uniref:hypothetical protein n=1 Tax=Nonomuraea sp. NPDC023979 TaxID=3154796 RepID=UPI0033D5692A
MTTSESATVTRVCPTCRATGLVTDDTVGTLWTENGVTIEQFHAADCADYLAQHARLMEGAERARLAEERARELFPEAHARFRTALQALPTDEAGPFAAALAELVALQARRFYGHGGFVILPEWADVLDRHFPAGQ